MGGVGVFGGTFDPPHLGHLIVAQDVLEALGLDRLLLVPAGDPPHRDGPFAPAELRARMLEAAVAGTVGLEVSRLELERSGPSYTVDTLRELALPRDALHLVIGVDQLEALHTWKEPEELARLARLVVMAREGRDPREVVPRVDLEYEVVPVTRVDLSSTGIRRRIAEGRSVRYRLPEAVLKIVEEENLYARSGPLPRAGAGASDR